VANLSEVMGIFSDILSKSRFEQQPIKGNFLPRRSPKDNTTSDNEDESAVLLTKESPRPVPGTSAPHPDPKRREKPKGRRAGGTFEADAAVPDDSTYIIGMEKAEGTSGERGWKAIRSGRLSSKYRPYTKDKTPDRHSGKTGYARQGHRFDRPRDKAKNIDRATIRKPETINSMEKASEDKGGLSSDENADRLNEEALRRQAITSRGFTPKYGEAGSEVYNRSRPPSPTRRKQLQDRFRRQVTEDNQLNMEKASYVRDERGHKIAGQRISGKYPNRLSYLREAARYQDRKPKPSIMEQREPADTPERDPNRAKPGEWKGGKWHQALWKARKNNIYAIATAGADGDEDKKEEIVRALKRGKMMLKAFGIPITKIKWPIPNPSPGEESPFRRSPKPPPKGKRGKAYTIVGSEQAEKIKAMEAKEKAKHPGEPLFAHPLYRPKPAMGFQTSSGKKDTRETGDPHEPYEDKGTLGFKRSFLKARILKAFGVPISMPGGKQRILPINPNSEGGFFIKETWIRDRPLDFGNRYSKGF